MARSQRRIQLRAVGPDLRVVMPKDIAKALRVKRGDYVFFRVTLDRRVELLKANIDLTSMAIDEDGVPDTPIGPPE